MPLASLASRSGQILKNACRFHRRLSTCHGTEQQLTRGWSQPSDMAILGLAHPRRTCRTLPSVLMRAGTSKGLFIHRKDLPDQQSDWAPHLISALGSQGADPRQIDGIGGGTSTTSKVAVISPSNRPGIDVDFTFVQVEVGKESVDFTGNCGNIVSVVGPFAVQEGLVRPVAGKDEV